MSGLVDARLGSEAARLTGFAIDHRHVRPGHVFGAFHGQAANGEDHIAAAVAAGALAVVARPAARVEGALHLADEHPRALFARLAAEWLGPFPATAVAVTGTNGKTSTVELWRQLWRMAGARAASIGTLGVSVGAEAGDAAEPAGRGGLTSPDVVTFLSTAAGLAREGVSHLAFEASSHGLDQHRVDGVAIAAAGFTSFGRDHLDYHGTLDAYFQAKLRLFTAVLPPGSPAVVWRAPGEAGDDAAGRVAAAARAAGREVLEVGPGGAFARLAGLQAMPRGQRLEVEFAGRRHAVLLPLIGAYQAANALVAAGLAAATGMDPAEALARLARVRGVRGRLEHVARTPAGADLYVDYAHTPEALEAAAAALRAHAPGRLVLVFGCGGDRDRGKRAPMGAVAARVADLAIVTDDNPRGEDSAAIRAEVLAGAPGLVEQGDRRTAIARAVAEAAAGDVVLVAGKGHETGQTIGGVVHPFDDVEVARRLAGGVQS